MIKNKTFQSLINGSLQDPNNPSKREYVHRYNNVILAKEFGFSYHEIMSMPQYFYDDCLLIMAKKNAIMNNKRK